MKDIETHGDRGRRRCLGRLSLTASGIGQCDSSFKPLAPIGNDMLEMRPRFDDLTPALAATIRTALSRQPRQAQGFKAHQDGLAMKKDFVQTQHQHPALASPIEDLQDATRWLSA